MSTGPNDMRPGECPLFTHFADMIYQQPRQERRPTIESKLREELAELDRRIKELRGARHALTYDLEQLLKEQDRLRRHLDRPDRG